MSGRVAMIAIVLALAIYCGAVDNPPPARLSQLRFSPDGRYVLAQDESAITILTVQPFKILFRIPAHQAELAQFTPDSRQIVFVSSAMRVDAEKIAIPKSSARVEHWSVGAETLVESVALPPLSCSTEKLSPDGGALVCVDFESTLRLVDVPSGATKFEKKHFAWLFGDYTTNPARPQPYTGVLGFANIDFSPDGRFVVVRPLHSDGVAVALNVREGRIVELAGGLKVARSPHWSAWMSPDRLLVSQSRRTKDDIARGLASAILIAFPSGQVLSRPKIPDNYFYQASDPSFILVRSFFGEMPSWQIRSEAVDINTGLAIVSNSIALDVLGHFYVAEPNPGEVGLYEIGKGLQVTILLPKD